MRTFLVVTGAGLEIAGFSLAAIAIREVRGPFGPERGIRKLWNRLRFVPIRKTHSLSFGADVVVTRGHGSGSVSFIKAPKWDRMTTERKFDWLRDQSLETQDRLNRLDVDLKNEAVLRQAELKDLGDELRREIHRELAGSETERVSKELLSLILFVLGLSLGTIGNLI